MITPGVEISIAGRVVVMVSGLTPVRFFFFFFFFMSSALIFYLTGAQRLRAALAMTKQPPSPKCSPPRH